MGPVCSRWWREAAEVVGAGSQRALVNILELEGQSVRGHLEGL